MSLIVRHSLSLWSVAKISIVFWLNVIRTTTHYGCCARICVLRSFRTIHFVVDVFFSSLFYDPVRWMTPLMNLQSKNDKSTYGMQLIELKMKCRAIFDVEREHCKYNPCEFSRLKMELSSFDTDTFISYPKSGWEIHAWRSNELRS